jgi:outer membrane protein, multidrug efflux system
MRLTLLVLSSLLLGGCAVGPEYRKPAPDIPTQWSLHQSGELVDIQEWWAQFNDPALSRLQDLAERNSPTLASAMAAIDKARASRVSSAAAYWPDITASGSDSHSGSLKHPTGVTHTTSAELDASWELDLFGKTRRNVESADALIEARQAEWASSRVSLLAEVATDYLDYRTCRIKQHYYEAQADSQNITVGLNREAWKAGFKAQADLRLAEASAASTRASALSQRSECEVAVKTLVALVGNDETQLRGILGADSAELPLPVGLAVDSVPADLLRRRPDIVVAERELASANALIGAAEAKRWPSLTLSGTVGLAKTAGAAATAPWSFVPGLSLPVFDGGSISAGIRSARADYASQLATYQQTVRDAVKEVEQALVRLDNVADREQALRLSAEGYRDYLAASERSWRVGTSSQLDLESARRSSISADISLIELQQTRLSYWIALYKAVGGGWQGSTEKSDGMQESDKTGSIKQGVEP